MRYTVKACTSAKYRRKNTIFLSIGLILSVVGIIMMIYSLVKSSWLFAASYFIALILLVTYIMIRFSTVYTTYLATDRENIYMRTWNNNFLPYDVNNRIKLFAEFVPAKTKLIQIPIGDITQIVIGTKNFIKRSSRDDDKFLNDIAPYEISKDYYKKRTVSSMDIIYFKLMDDDSYYMPILNFNTKNVIKILNIILKAKPDIEVNIGSRDYRTFGRTRDK